MSSNTTVLIVVFIFILLVLRGYMGLTVRLILNKKERRQYRSSYSLLSRWFFWSTHEAIKDIKDKYEKRTIRYKSIMVIYKYLNIILHFELLALTVCYSLSCVNDYYKGSFTTSCWIYTISVACSFLILVCVEIYQNRRFHRDRCR